LREKKRKSGFPSSIDTTTKVTYFLTVTQLEMCWSFQLLYEIKKNKTKTRQHKVKKVENFVLEMLSFRDNNSKTLKCYIFGITAQNEGKA
jgi:hypothetical protein